MLARALVLALLFGVVSGVASAQPGTPDPTFGTDGQVTLADAPPQGAAAVVSLPDGRLLVAGSRGGDAAVYRFTAAGALDASFGTGGVFAVDLGDDDRAVDLAVTPAGRIVVAANRTNDSVTEAAFLLGVTADGRLDDAFGISGRVAVAAGGSGVTGLGLDRDGGVVVALIRNEEPEGVFVVRYGPGGARDAGFGTGGETLLPDVGFSGRVAALGDGRILAVGARVVGEFGLALTPVVARLTADGALDPAFAGDGVAELTFGGSFDILLDVAADGQGRVVAVGLASTQTTSSLVVARLTADGTPDASFAGGGVASLTLGQTLAQGTSVLIQPDGRIVAGGAAGPATGSGLAVARLLPDGTLDGSFGNGGAYVGATDQQDGLNDIAFRPDGRIIGVGPRLGSDGAFGPSVALRAVSLLGGGGTPSEAEPAAAFALAPAGANPSTGRVGVRLTLDAPDAVRADVFDAAGRRVAALWDGPLGAGPHTLAAPRRLAAGVYVVRVRVGGAERSVAVTVAR